MVIASAVERFGLLLAVLPLLVVAGSVRRLADRPDGAAVRRGARRALAALAAGRMRVRSDGVGPFEAVLEAEVRRDGVAGVCRDRRPAELQALVLIGGRLSIGEEGRGYSPSDLLRSRCPGPYGAPVRGPLATGDVALRRLGAPRLTVERIR